MIILGGGREAAVPNHEYNITDDSTVNPVISKVLGEFLPRLYPTDFENLEPEMEWVSVCLFILVTRRLILYTDGNYGIHSH